MNRDNYFIEEYKFCNEAMDSHFRAYTRLEQLTFSGAAAIYGLLLGVSPTLQGRFLAPPFVWWGLLALVFISCGRCWGHYLLIRKLAGYVALMESEIYGIEFDPNAVTGIQRYHSQYKLGPQLNLIINAIFWCLLIGFAFVMAIQHGGSLKFWP